MGIVVAADTDSTGMGVGMEVDGVVVGTKAEVVTADMVRDIQAIKDVEGTGDTDMAGPRKEEM